MSGAKEGKARRMASKLDLVIRKSRKRTPDLNNRKYEVVDDRGFGLYYSDEIDDVLAYLDEVKGKAVQP